MLYWSGTLKLESNKDSELDKRYRTAAAVFAETQKVLGEKVGRAVTAENLIYCSVLHLANALGVVQVKGFKLKPAKSARQRASTPKLDSVDVSIL